MLALKNATSTVRNSAAIGASLRFDVPQRKRATARKSTVLRMKVAGDRDAVDVAQPVGGPEDERQRHDADAQAPVDDRDVDLAFKLGGVADREAGKEAKLDRLSRHRERARDRRL